MIRILTDSATDFTQEELQKLNVRCVPMTIAFGGDTYTDGVDLPQEIFWQRMEAGQTPKTSQPSPDAFLREFEAAKAAGDSVLCVLVSSALSGTLQSALIAVGMTEDLDVALVDSLRVPNTFWTPSYKISRIIVKRLWFAKSSRKKSSR